jgi:hypothetical protein
LALIISAGIVALMVAFVAFLIAVILPLRGLTILAAIRTILAVITVGSIIAAATSVATIVFLSVRAAAIASLLALSSGLGRSDLTFFKIPLTATITGRAIFAHGRVFAFRF